MKALSPTCALTFMVGHFHIAFFALAAVVLAVTRAEALYADTRPKARSRRGCLLTMARWRKRLFIATSHITAHAAEYFGLPGERTVIMGSRIDV